MYKNTCFFYSMLLHLYRIYSEKQFIIMHYTNLKVLVVTVLSLWIYAPLSWSQQQESSEFPDVPPDRKLTELIESRKQSGFSGTEFKPFSVSTSKSRNNHKNVLTDATYLDLNKSALKTILKTPEEGIINLSLPFKDGGEVEFELVECQNFSDDFLVSTTAGQEKIKIEELGKFYRGICKYKPGTIAAFSVFEDHIIGMYSDETGNHILAPVEGEDIHIFYASEDLLLTRSDQCSTDLIEQTHLLKNADDDGLDKGNGGTTSKCIDVYMEVDHALYRAKGTVVKSVQYIASIFNNVAALYHNESINIFLSEVHVWTSRDPYSSSSAVIALNQFRNLRNTYNGTIAHLAALGGKNLGGVAWLDVLCHKSFRYAYSNIHADFDNIPIYSWSVEVIAHEIGHNLGSRHTHWCGWPGGPIDDCFRPEGACNRGQAPDNGGTVMSYCHLTSHGINFANGFGPLPGDRIRHRVFNAPCLSSCIVDDDQVCQRPGGLKIDDLTTEYVKISWIPFQAVQEYEIKYKDIKDTTDKWTSVKVDTTAIELEYLDLSTDYAVEVVAWCDSTDHSQPSARLNFTTPGHDDYCDARGLNSALQWISLFELGDINRISGSDGGYFDATHMSTEIEPGKSYVIKFQSDVVVGPVALFWRMWIDYDGNGSFNDEGELVFGRISNSSNPMARVIHIPEDVSIGQTRLRIALKYGGHATACETFNEGEVEDYTINIVPRGSAMYDHSVDPDHVIEEVNLTKAYPNPVDRDLIYTVQSNHEGSGTVSVLNILGESLLFDDVHFKKGETTQALDLNQLIPGTYVLVLTHKNRVMQHKFVKQ